MTRYDTTKMYPLDATVGRWLGRAASVAFWALMAWVMFN